VKKIIAMATQTFAMGGRRYLLGTRISFDERQLSRVIAASSGNLRIEKIEEEVIKYERGPLDTRFETSRTNVLLFPFDATR
jgi:hypothetical protein